MRAKLPQLSKSRFLAGMQCHKRLYLECYHYNEKDKVSAAQQAVFDVGSRVGEFAQQRFPGGLLVTETHLEHDKAIKSTEIAMQSPDVSAIYEAAFVYDDIKIRVDILVHENNDQVFDLVEVKSSTKVKEEHLYDLAVQLYVLRGLGLNVRRCYLMHINSGYVYEGGEYDLNQLYTLQNLSNEIEAKLTEVPSLLTQMRRALHDEDPPAQEIGSHCNKPYKCSFYAYCHSAVPSDHVTHLPRLSDKLLKKLRGDGIERIPEIPADYAGLTPVHWRMRQALLENAPQFDNAIFDELAALCSPLYFLDFETFNPALPAFPATRPYEQVPFQWSAHVLDDQGQLEHFEFIADGKGDPRRQFAETLITTLRDTGPIIVYSSFEKTCLNALIKRFRDLADSLSQIIDRFVDLYTLVRNHAYHPRFQGSFSIKYVLPALVPQLTYSGLAIADGATASSSFAKTLSVDIPEDEKRKIYQDLLAYCKQDTLAMVEIYRTLIALHLARESA